MNLHEYQGKEILAGYGVRIQRGKVAQTPAEAVEVAKQLTEETGTSWYVVKAQVHAGGRGKGGGVKLAKGIDKVEEVANSIYLSNGSARLTATLRGLPERMTTWGIVKGLCKTGQWPLRPLMSIHFEAVKLWIKKVPFHRRPEPPAAWSEARSGK